jgi:hypothetical protein
MFETICEMARLTARNNYLKKRVTSIKKSDRVVAVRPIERARRTAADETSSEQNPNFIHLDDGETRFEKYDAHGNVVLHTHPQHRPISKTA